MDAYTRRYFEVIFFVQSLYNIICALRSLQCRSGACIALTVPANSNKIIVICPEHLKSILLDIYLKGLKVIRWHGEDLIWRGLRKKRSFNL